MSSGGAAAEPVPIPENRYVSFTPAVSDHTAAINDIVVTLEADVGNAYPYPPVPVNRP